MSDHRFARMAALRARGATLHAIGQEFGLTRERVRQILCGGVKRGSPRRTGRPRKGERPNWALAEMLRHDGIPTWAIAEELGVSPSNVSKHFRGAP